MPAPRIALPDVGVVLRGWQPDDAPSLAAHANDRRVWRNLCGRFPHPYTAANAAA